MSGDIFACHHGESSGGGGGWGVGLGRYPHLEGSGQGCSTFYNSQNILQLARRPHNKELPSFKLSGVEKSALYFHQLLGLPTFYAEEPGKRNM